MTQLEEKVSEATEQLLKEHETHLRTLGLRADFRGLQVFDENPKTRTSEVEVVFYRGSQFVDIFEFFVMRNGQVLTSVFEVQEWLRRELGELGERHGE